MFYEISREEFKKRLGSKLNFSIVDLNSETEELKDTIKMSYTENFSSTFSQTESDKNKNIILFSFKKGDDTPKLAAESLNEAGFANVYFYRGEEKDVQLDKGLN
jgi:hypothetical protein